MRNGRLLIQWHPLLAGSLLIGLAGCGAARHASMTTPLLPEATEYAASEAVHAPPSLEASLFYINSEPGFLNDTPRRLPEPANLEAVIQRSQSRFESGRRLYRAGQMEAARREFDRAVEVLLAVPANASERQTLERRLVELTDAIHQYDVSGLGGGVPEDEPVFESSPLEEIPEPTFPIDPKLRNQVAEELKTTVSQLPLELNDEVLRYIKYFTTERGRRTMENGLRRSGRYRGMIRRIFDEEGIPQELIHLAQAESGFAPRAVSSKKATGMWQFIQSRGREYGLLQTKTTDDRLDPERATRAAARHLKDLYNQFGDWYLAMAAYNCGPLNVEKAVARTGYADFWELRRRNVLPRETANYVPIILAMVIIAKNPNHYGLSEIEPEPGLEYGTIALESATSLDLIGDIVEQPVSELRSMNPSLLANIAPAGHLLHVPSGSAAAVQAALSAIPPERRENWRLHRFTEGESLAAIAARHRTTAKEILALNPEAAEGPSPGSVLIVPASPPPPRRTAQRTTHSARNRAARPAPGKAPSATKAPAGKTAATASARAAGMGTAKSATPAKPPATAPKGTATAANKQPPSSKASGTASR